MMMKWTRAESGAGREARKIDIPGMSDFQRPFLSLNTAAKTTLRSGGWKAP